MTEPLLIAAYCLSGVVGLIWLKRLIDGPISILDAALCIAVGWFAGLPLLLIAAVAWMCSQPGSAWLRKPRW